MADPRAPSTARAYPPPNGRRVFPPGGVEAFELMASQMEQVGLGHMAGEFVPW